jgi:hypothetical protein
MTIGDVIVKSSRLFRIGHIIVLNEVDDLHNPSKIVSCVFRKHKRHDMHGINLAHQLIVSVTIEDVMVRSSRLLRVGHIIVLNEVDNLCNLSKIVC